MNNASKGRCVTVTPRGKSEDETLKAKPLLRKGQYCCQKQDTLPDLEGLCGTWRFGLI